MSQAGSPVYMRQRHYILEACYIDNQNQFRIVNVVDPVDPQDVVTHAHHDADLVALQSTLTDLINSQSGYPAAPTYTVTLTGETKADVVALTKGAFVVKVGPDPNDPATSNGPHATFHAAKAHLSHGSISRTTVSGGAFKLNLSWHLNEPIRVWKTGGAPDGDYRVTLA